MLATVSWEFPSLQALERENDVSSALNVCSIAVRRKGLGINLANLSANLSVLNKLREL